MNALDEVDAVLVWAQRHALNLRNRGYDDPLPDVNKARERLGWYERTIRMWKEEEEGWHESAAEMRALLLKAGEYLQRISNEEAQEIATEIFEMLGGGSDRHAEARGAEAQDPTG